MFSLLAKFFDARSAQLSLLVAILAATAVPAFGQPSPDYAPILREPVFNVRDYGALGDDTGDDTDAIRAAMEACGAAGGGTVYLPAGTYRVCPKSSGAYTFYLTSSNLTFEGDGADKTTLNFLAWGMQDPEGLILKRGGGFRTNPAKGTKLENVLLRGFRATGNASPNIHAGEWWDDDSLVGWDISHKGLGIWGAVNNLTVEDCEWDHWRGEIIYSGGGLELGAFTILRSRIHNCNASAISMGGDILVQDCEIFDVHNGTECLSMGKHQKLVVRNCVIEPNRNFPSDMKIGKFGVVYLGYRDSSLVVENCRIGETNSGGVFLSEMAHNVTIEGNTFTDTKAVYAYFMDMYSSFMPGIENEYGFNDISIRDNTFIPKTKTLDDVFNLWVGGINNLRIIGNEVQAVNGHTYKNFLRGVNNITVAGEFLLQDNTLTSCEPVNGYSGQRPRWINNEVLGSNALGTIINNFTSPTNPAPIVIQPFWPRVCVNALKDGTYSRELKVAESCLPYLYEGFELEIRRNSGRDYEQGVEIKPDPTWNNLERGYIVYHGGVLKLRVGANGLFDLVAFQANDVKVRTLTNTTPNYARSLTDLSVYGQTEVKLAPAVRHGFNTFSGVAEGDTVAIHHNALTTIERIPGVIEPTAGESFVATASGTLYATRRNGVLIVQTGENLPPVVSATPLVTEHGTALEFTLPVSDPEGAALSLELAQAPLGGTIDTSHAPVLTYHPGASFVGDDALIFNVSDGFNTVSCTLTIKVRAPAPDKDTDADGIPDAQEILFGSDPADPSSVFAMAVGFRAEGVIEVHLPAVANRTITAVVESSSNLSDWTEETVIDSETMTPAGLEDLCLEFACDPTTITQKFFRLKTVAAAN